MASPPPPPIPRPCTCRRYYGGLCLPSLGPASTSGHCRTPKYHYCFAEGRHISYFNIFNRGKGGGGGGDGVINTILKILKSGPGFPPLPKSMNMPIFPTTHPTLNAGGGGGGEEGGGGGGRREEGNVVPKHPMFPVIPM